MLTESEAVSGKLPLVAIVREAVTLLIQRHLVRVHDDGQVTSFDVRRAGLEKGFRTGNNKSQIQTSSLPPYTPSKHKCV